MQTLSVKLARKANYFTSEDAFIRQVINALRSTFHGRISIQVLATRLVIASTGGMLIVGHEAPVGFRPQLPNRILNARISDNGVFARG
jgi:hypothetical protein